MPPRVSSGGGTPMGRLHSVTAAVAGWEGLIPACRFLGRLLAIAARRFRQGEPLRPSEFRESTVGELRLRGCPPPGMTPVGTTTQRHSEARELTLSARLEGSGRGPDLRLDLGRVCHCPVRCIPTTRSFGWEGRWRSPGTYSTPRWSTTVWPGSASGSPRCRRSTGYTAGSGRGAREGHRPGQELRAPALGLVCSRTVSRLNRVCPVSPKFDRAAVGRSEDQ
jgi:hypothetical protein